MTGQTIAAIATARGEAAIGIVRTSGPDALLIARQLCDLPDNVEGGRAYVRELRSDEQRLDEAVVLVSIGPRSFTGEDCVEYQCHGGPVTLHAVLRAVIAQGARVAEPGEFSRRAMLNGKLDLLQVEAIADIIHAESEAAHRLAQEHLSGRLSRAVDDLKAELSKLLALVEAAIDFSLEEHVYTISCDEIIAGAEPVLSGVKKLLDTYDSGRLQYEGVRVAIIGKPNAGKSTLLNLLLREDRAIVTEIAGTTRDYLEESCRIDGVLYRLVDTAGLRATEDVVEKAGIDRSREIAASADVTLVVADLTDPNPFADVPKAEEGRPRGVLWNKADLVAMGDHPNVRAQLEEEHSGATGERQVTVSLREESSVGEVERLLRLLAEDAGYADSGGSALLTRERHFRVLSAAGDSLERATSAARAEMPHEFIASDLREALDRLGDLTGAITSDDILNRIFGDFCIGK